MIKKGILVILINIIGVALSANILSVPEDVMSFIMGCDGRFSGIEGPKIPVTRTEIDSVSGVENKKTSMMNIAELRQSLMDTVESDDVVSQILAQVEESLEGRQIVEDKSAQCTNIKIDVPPQEVKGLNEQLQAIVQQNNYQLLEQVNTLFSFKLNSFYKEFEEMLEKKLAELGAGLIQFQQAQQASAQKPPEPQPDSSIGETRIFSSNTPIEAFPAVSPGLVVKEAPPSPQDYDVEEVPQSEKISPSELQDYSDYPDENEVLMEEMVDVPLETEHFPGEERETPIQTTEQATSSTTSSTTTTTTTSATTTTTTTTEPSTTASTTTTTTTTTTPAPPSEEPSTEGPKESVRAPFRRRRPGILPNPRRPGIRRPISTQVEEELEESAAPEIPEEPETLPESPDSEPAVELSQSNVQSRRSRLDEMKKKRKALLERLRGGRRKK